MRGEMTWNEWFLGNLVLDSEYNFQTLPNLTPSTTYFNIAVVGSRQELFPEDQFLEIVIRETDGDEFEHKLDLLNGLVGEILAFLTLNLNQVLILL